MGLILFLVLLINYYHFNCDYNMLDVAHTIRAWNASSLRKLILCLQKRKGMKKKQSSHWGGIFSVYIKQTECIKQFVPLSTIYSDYDNDDGNWNAQLDLIRYDAIRCNAIQFFIVLEWCTVAYWVGMSISMGNWRERNVLAWLNV